MATVVDAVVGKPVEAQPEHIQVEEHEESRCSPFCYAKPAVERPCSTCASFCGCLLFFIVLVGALLAGGVEVIRFTNEVPFVSAWLGIRILKWGRGSERWVCECDVFGSVGRKPWRQPMAWALRDAGTHGWLQPYVYRSTVEARQGGA